VKKGGISSGKWLFLPELFLVVDPLNAK